LPVIPVAAFLAGALRTILLPLALLIALLAWYWVFAKRVPETAERGGPGSTVVAANPLPGPGPGTGPGTEAGPPAHGA
jgi:hypothetical protein